MRAQIDKYHVIKCRYDRYICREEQIGLSVCCFFRLDGPQILKGGYMEVSYNLNQLQQRRFLCAIRQLMIVRYPTAIAFGAL